VFVPTPEAMIEFMLPRFAFPRVVAGHALKGYGLAILCAAGALAITESL
jgi:hypothetical protein